MIELVPCRMLKLKISALVLLLSCFGFAGAKTTVWPVDSLVKVFPDDAQGVNRDGAEVTLLPRNGHASVQFAVRSDAPVSDLSVTVTVAGPVEAQVRHVGYVPVHKNTPDSPPDEWVRKAPSRFPDPLFEQFPFSIAADETNAVWITLHAAADAQPGEYAGHADFRSGGRQITSAPFRVRVMRAVVPKQTLKISNWFNLDKQHLAAYFDIGNDDKRYWNLLGNIGRVMADHRQNVMLTPVLSLTDARVENGAIGYDFSRLDRWLDTFGRSGADGADRRRPPAGP